MTPEEIKAKLEDLVVEVNQLSTITPKDFNEFNTVRLQYDTLQARMSGYQMQLQALYIIDQIAGQSVE